MRRFFSLFLAVMSTAVCAWAGDAPSASPHHFSEEQCAACHAEIPVKGEKGRYKMTGSISALCNRCHSSAAMARVLSHPMDIKPVKSSIPARFPLSYDGLFTCSTCHDIHANPVKEANVRSFYLRNKPGEGNLCIQCHTGGSVSHSTLLSVAHMGERKEVSSLPIDEVSSRCLTCHDGVNAPFAATRVAKEGAARFCPEDDTKHPIGMEYETSRRSRADLNPLERVDKALLLFGGKVGCATCHDPYSNNKKMLVISNQGSRLCMQCHNK